MLFVFLFSLLPWNNAPKGVGPYRSPFDLWSLVPPRTHTFCANFLPFLRLRHLRYLIPILSCFLSFKLNNIPLTAFWIVTSKSLDNVYYFTSVGGYLNSKNDRTSLRLAIKDDKSIRVQRAGSGFQLFIFSCSRAPTEPQLYFNLSQHRKPRFLGGRQTITTARKSAVNPTTAAKRHEISNLFSKSKIFQEIYLRKPQSVRASTTPSPKI